MFEILYGQNIGYSSCALYFLCELFAKLAAFFGHGHQEGTAASGQGVPQASQFSLAYSSTLLSIEKKKT